MKEFEPIELRSEKVRSVIGEKPPIFIQYGMLLITIIIVSLFMVAYLIPYSEIINCKVVDMDANHIKVCVPYRYIDKVKEGGYIKIKFEDNLSENNSFSHGKIINISKKDTLENNDSVFYAVVLMNNHQYKPNKDTHRKVFISIHNKKIWEYIVSQ